MENKIDFNSPEWEERLKGKTPEEIAEMVATAYEDEKIQDFFPNVKGLIIFLSIIFLIFILALIFLLLIRFSTSKKISINKNFSDTLTSTQLLFI